MPYVRLDLTASVKDRGRIWQFYRTSASYVYNKNDQVSILICDYLTGKSIYLGETKSVRNIDATFVFTYSSK